MFLALMLSGCTMPATKVAMTALETENRQLETVQNDLVVLANQMTLDRSDAEAKVPGVNVTQVLEKQANALLRIAWLDKEWVKARLGPGGLVRQYIGQQKGILDWLAENWGDAKAATQPGG
jgi:hypothetical protein